MASKLFVVVLRSVVDGRAGRTLYLYTSITSPPPFSPGAFCDMKTRLKAILPAVETSPPPLCGNLSVLFVCGDAKSLLKA